MELNKRPLLSCMASNNKITEIFLLGVGGGGRGAGCGGGVQDTCELLFSPDPQNQHAKLQFDQERVSNWLESLSTGPQVYQLSEVYMSKCKCRLF